MNKYLIIIFLFISCAMPERLQQEIEPLAAPSDNKMIVINSGRSNFRDIEEVLIDNDVVFFGDTLTTIATKSELTSATSSLWTVTGSDIYRDSRVTVGGTLSPRSDLVVANGDGPNSNPKITLESEDTSVVANDKLGTIDWYTNDTSGALQGVIGRLEMEAVTDFSATAPTSMVFRTNNGATGTLGEVLRLNNLGEVIVGATDNGAYLFQTNGDVYFSGDIYKSTVSIKSGTGTPEGFVTATVGSLYLRDDGGVGTTLYTKESGVGNTGWATVGGGGGSTALSTGTVTATTYGITSDGGVDDVVLVEATTSTAGLLGSAKWNEIVANTAKVSFSNLTGDVTSVGAATTISAGAVDIAMLSATGTPDGTTFLRGDNTWAVPVGAGDMVLASAQTNSGIKTFLDGTFKLRNVANTFDGYFVNTNTADRIYTLQDAAGTLAFLSDITGTNSGTNTGDQTITLTGDVTGTGTGSFATTIAVDAVDISMLSADGTADGTTYLRGDNTWAVPFDPSSNITFSGNNTHSGTEGFTNTVTITGVDIFNLQQSASNGTYAVIQSGGSGGAGLKTYGHSGTIGSPALTTNGQFIGLWSARGHNGTALTTGASAYLGFLANQAWSSGANGSRAVIATTPNNSTTAAIRLYVDNDGDVALGATAPTTSAKLDIQGTDGSLLLPRLTTAQRNALTAANGMMIYNTTTTQPEFYENGAWVGRGISNITIVGDTVNFISKDSTFKLQSLGTLEITASGDSIGIAGGGNKLATDDIGTKELFISVFGSGTSVTTGDGTVALPISFSFNGMNLVDVIVTTYAKGITGTTDVMVRRSRGGTDVDMLSSPVTLGDEFYALDGTVNLSNDDVQTGDMIFVDVDAVHSGTAPLGMSVSLEFRKP